MRIKRREFLSLAAMSAAAFALGGCKTNRASATGFRLAMAGYTLKSFRLDEALKFCRETGFENLCVKNFHLPFDASKKDVELFRRKCADYGIFPYAVGPIYMYGREEAKKYFDYAALLGVDMIVGVPGKLTGPNKWVDCCSDRDLCEFCSEKADEYSIRFAIHNHGRNPKTGNPKLYPAVPEIYDLISDLSPRMGLCVDWAYTYADSLDCREIAKKYRSRIFDGHVRCISDANNGSSGTNPARRSFDYDAVFDALRDIGYNGYLGLELANAFPENPQWIRESFEYFKGLM